MRLVGPLVALLWLAACGSEPGEEAPDAGELDGGGSDAASGTAPPGALDGERAGEASNDIEVSAGGAAVVRFETVPGEHVGFRLVFPAAQRGVVLVVERWNGTEPVFLGETDAGAGLRVLAVLDQDKDLAGLIGRIRERGTAVLVIEHHMGLIMEVGSRIVVLNFGQKIAEGTPAEIQVHPAVRKAYLGGEKA